MKASRLPSLLLLLVMAFISACASTTKGPRVDDALSRDQELEAGKVYEQLVALSASGQSLQARDLAYEILDHYPGYKNEDHVLLLGAQASRDLNDDRTARVLLEELFKHHSTSSYLPDARWFLAQVYDQRAEWHDAALAYLRYLELGKNLPESNRAEARLKIIIHDELNLSELDRLRSESMDTGSGGEVFFVLLERQRDSGAQPHELGPMLEEFLTRYPEDPHYDEVAQMLAVLRSAGSYQPSTGIPVVYIDRVGVLCPLTGEYAALGQAMYDGALLALEEHNRLFDDELKLVALDTHGDGVQAVLSARSLIDDEGVLSIVGALLSPTTIAAAVVCQDRGVPLISPTATQENISAIGDVIFQTNLTREFETREIARVAVQRLLRRRLAILYPDTDEGRNAAEVFSEEAENLGGQIVSSEPYESGLTDFKTPIERIRARGPEALFVPAGPSEMRLIAPQLTFYQLEVQLLGVSSWSHPRLANDAGDVLDRAIFPSDTALMAPGERQRFQELWRRRFHEDEINSFGLKTYFATRRVFTAIHDGARSRNALIDELRRNLIPVGNAENTLAGESSLRMFERGKVVPFPSSIFGPPAQSAAPQTTVEEEGNSAAPLSGEGG